MISTELTMVMCVIIAAAIGIFIMKYTMKESEKKQEKLGNVLHQMRNMDMNEVNNENILRLIPG